jgi:hypothetical protein
MPNIPAQSSGGRNRYAEIMSQYQQAQPLSFTGMPSTYTGGFTPYQRPIPAPVQQNPYAGLIEQLGGGSGGGGRGEREAPSAFSQMTPAERAAYYAANPTEGKIALGAQDLLGNASLMGQIGKYFGADRFYDSRLEKMGVNPTISVDTQNALAGEAMQRALDSQAQSQAVAAQQAQDARVAAFDASRESSRGGGGGGMGGGAATGGRDTGGGARDASGGGDRGTRGGFAYGGYVSMQHLGGPDPEGPDDGYAALKDGEFVINDKAVKKYGIELMNAINSGKISKGKLLGLLEM